MNNEVVYQMMERIKDYPLEDPLGLVDIYLNKRDMVQLNQYINRHFRKWAKEYHLDRRKLQMKTGWITWKLIPHWAICQHPFM